MTSSSPFSTVSNSCSTPPPLFTQTDPRTLKPHLRNSTIYGLDEDVTELVAMIRISGWVKPLVVTPTGTIISGHQRWKAVLALGWQSIVVEVREFPDELKELEALLLENASRFKTTEQKVREAEAWKEVEAKKARQRMSDAAKALRQGVENFPHPEKGKTRDRIAARVGLGSGRTYSKAAKVVEAIDLATSAGSLETAQTLRQVLNSKSVDAAVRLLPFTTKRAAPTLSSIGQKLVESDLESDDPRREGHTASSRRSCWNCQHRGELIENHSFYCNKLGVLSLLDKNVDTRGAECDLWSYRGTDSEETKTQPTPTFTLTLPAHLQPLIQDAARTAGMSLMDWATWVLESAARATCFTSCCTDSSAVQQTNKTERPTTQCRSS